MGTPTAVEHPHSTLEGISDRRPTGASTWIRRGFLLLVLLFVVAGLCGFLGVKSETTSTSAGGYQVSLTYARIARPGLDVPWRLTVTHPGGFSGPIRIRATADYFDILDSTSLVPQPASETRDGSWWYWTFSAPRGDTLVVELDSYIQPSSQQGRSGTLQVLDGDLPTAAVSFSTTLIP